MNNPRLKGVVNNFGERLGIDNDLSIRYQCFANYLFLKKVYFDVNGIYPYESTLDLELLQNIDFDKGEDHAMAIDGCFGIYKKNIIHLEMNDDEINEQFDKIEDGILNIVLIQTKSGDIATTDLSTLSDCLSANFNKQPKWEKFVSFREKCENLIQSKPKVKIKFTALYISGNTFDPNTWQQETFIIRIEALKKAMKDYFWIIEDSDCEIKVFDESEIYNEHEKQNENKMLINSTLLFEQITDSIDCHDYGTIRVGVITVNELKKILINPDTNLPNELYGYNVRDVIAADRSKVNQKIIDTLLSDKEMFPLLNNGITLVVNKQERKGDKGIYLENIRIVNGCQTSHAIMNAINTDSTCLDTKVSVKIIETDNDDILGKITYSSNNQNTVTSSNLFAIEPSIFKLEKEYKDFFLAYPTTSFKTVFLERRQGQFSNTSDTFIDLVAQAKAFVAIWNATPHKAVMYSEENLDEFRKHIDEDSFIDKSLFCGVIWTTVSEIIKNHFIKYWNARFHIFFCVVFDLLELTTSTKPIIDHKILQQKLIECKTDLKSTIQNVCNAIDQMPDDFPKLVSGKFHYRKFYPADAFQKIYSKFLQNK